MTHDDLDAYLRRRWTGACSLDRTLWGPYKRKHAPSRRPACCGCLHKATYQDSIEGYGTVYFCDYHAARIYMARYRRLWDVAQRIMEEEEEE